MNESEKLVKYSGKFNQLHTLSPYKNHLDKKKTSN